MRHTSDIYVLRMVTTDLWPDRHLDPRLVSHIDSSQFLPLCFLSIWSKLWPKTDNFEVSIARNLKAPILTFNPTLTWHVTLFGKYRCFRIVSSRACERRVARFSATICSPVMGWEIKGTIPPCLKLFFIPKLYVKRFSTFHWSCWSLFSQKYCVTCKKSTLKVLMNFGFMTSFVDSHYILLFR